MERGQEDQISRRDSILDQIAETNRLLANLYGLRKMGSLGPWEKEQLDRASEQKHRLMVKALELKRDGDQSIKVTIYGELDDELHKYSRNRVDVEFPVSGSSNKTYRTTSSLDHLNAIFEGDINSLIGCPDGFVSEPTGDYIRRTIAEISALGHDLDKTMTAADLVRKQQLSRLKARLAARIVRKRINSGLTRRVVEVKLLRDKGGEPVRDLVEINYYPAKGEEKWGFHLPICDPFYKLQVAPLIEELGGFDRETRGRSRQKRHHHKGKGRKRR